MARMLFWHISRSAIVRTLAKAGIRIADRMLTTASVTSSSMRLNPRALRLFLGWRGGFTMTA